jgi:hypothetical protein
MTSMMFPIAYRLFLDPLPVWNYWLLLIVPLCAAAMTVYKAMKCRSMWEVPREAAVNVLLILSGFAAAAVGLMVLVNWLGR